MARRYAGDVFEDGCVLGRLAIEDAMYDLGVARGSNKIQRMAIARQICDKSLVS